jgi:hypothetical protein
MLTYQTRCRVSVAFRRFRMPLRKSVDTKYSGINPVLKGSMNETRKLLASETSKMKVQSAA